MLSLLWSTVTASVTLHNKLLGHILRLPKSFFDTNPAGRVLNRFSKDVETMDSVLNQSISQLCNCFATYFATLIVITIATKWFGLAVIPITAVYIILQVRRFCFGWAGLGWLGLGLQRCRRCTRLLPQPHTRLVPPASLLPCAPPYYLVLLGLCGVRAPALLHPHRA